MNFEEILKTIFKDTTTSNLLILGGVSFITYILARLQSLKELTRIGIENNLKRIEQLEKLYKIDEEIRTNLLSLRSRLRELRKLIASKEIEKAVLLKEEIFEDFVIKYAGAYYKYFNYARWVYQSNRTELIEEDLFPFLQNCKLMMEENINFPPYIQALNEKKSEIEYTNFDFAINYIEKNLWFWDKKRKIKIKNYREYFQSISPKET